MTIIKIFANLSMAFVILSFLTISCEKSESGITNQVQNQNNNGDIAIPSKKFKLQSGYVLSDRIFRLTDQFSRRPENRKQYEKLLINELDNIFATYEKVSGKKLRFPHDPSIVVARNYKAENVSNSIVFASDTIDVYRSTNSVFVSPGSIKLGQSTDTSALAGVSLDVRSIDTSRNKDAEIAGELTLYTSGKYLGAKYCNDALVTTLLNKFYRFNNCVDISVKKPPKTKLKFGDELEVHNAYFENNVLTIRDKGRIRIIRQGKYMPAENKKWRLVDVLEEKRMAIVRNSGGFKAIRLKIPKSRKYKIADGFDSKKSSDTLSPKIYKNKKKIALKEKAKAEKQLKKLEATAENYKKVIDGFHGSHWNKLNYNDHSRILRASIDKYDEWLTTIKHVEAYSNFDEARLNEQMERVMKLVQTGFNADKEGRYQYSNPYYALMEELGALEAIKTIKEGKEVYIPFKRSYYKPQASAH